MEKVFGKNYEQILCSFGSEAETIRLFENLLHFFSILFSVLGSCPNIIIKQTKKEINGRKNVCFEIQSVSARDTLKCQTIHDDDIFRG